MERKSVERSRKGSINGGKRQNSERKQGKKAEYGE